MDCCKQPIHRFAKEGLEKRETYQEKEQVSSDLDVSLTAQRFSPGAAMPIPDYVEFHRSESVVKGGARKRFGIIGVVGKR